MYGFIDEVQELRAENACLQERMKEAERQVEIALGMPLNERIDALVVSRDGYRALAERRKEALEELIPFCCWCGGKGLVPNEIDGIDEEQQCRWCAPARAAIEEKP